MDHPVVKSIEKTLYFGLNNKFEGVDIAAIVEMVIFMPWLIPLWIFSDYLDGDWTF